MKISLTIIACFMFLVQNEVKTDAGVEIKLKRSIIENFLNTDKDQQRSGEEENDAKIVFTPSEAAAESINKESKDIIKEVAYKRIKLPELKGMKVGHEKVVSLPGDIEARVKVLSTAPLIFEVEDFIDEDDCDLLIDLAKRKTMKPLKNKIADIHLQNTEQTFQLWDYNQDGVISPEEIPLLPALAGVRYTEEDADDMFFLLKMDPDKDGKVSPDEMRNTDFTKVRDYFTRIRSEQSRQRNISSAGAWVWHDEDELLKYQEDGYFEKYHERVSTLTGLPTGIIEESEPFQVRQFQAGEFQLARHDSEPTTKDIPCCLYGDVGKVCRLCRYISLSIFLNDVEDGGELVFPLANTKHQSILKNSGEWRGYYIYAKTTGNKFYFKADTLFQLDGANRVFKADGKDESGAFTFQNGIIIGNVVKFEKLYNNDNSPSSAIKYQGKLVDGSKISGYWWAPGQKRLRGSFFMWNTEYDIFSARAIDQSNTKTGCSKSSLTIKPKKGKAVIWYNHELNVRDGMIGDLNQESIYAQCEQGKGEKWIASTWINTVGDGDLNLRAWRRGNNLLTDSTKRKDIYSMLGTNDDKLPNEPYESEYLDEVLGTNATTGDGLDGYYRHKPASNALQALNLLFNDMDKEQLKLLASTVHKKLGLTCIPLTVQHAGKMSLVDGSIE